MLGRYRKISVPTECDFSRFVTQYANFAAFSYPLVPAIAKLD